MRKNSMAKCTVNSKGYDKSIHASVIFARIATMEIALKEFNLNFSLLVARLPRLAILVFYIIITNCLAIICISSCPPLVAVERKGEVRHGLCLSCDSFLECSGTTLSTRSTSSMHDLIVHLMF